MHSCGYVLKREKKHQKADKLGFVYEHRFNIENIIGRVLKRDEIVHHKDGDRTNNKKENLVILTQTEHSRLHEGWWKNGDKWFKICNFCGKSLEVNNDNFYQRNTGRFLAECKNCSKLKSSKVFVDLECIDCHKIRRTKCNKKPLPIRCNSCANRKVWQLRKELTNGRPKGSNKTSQIGS